jgi:hypothetical protein
MELAQYPPIPGAYSAMKRWQILFDPVSVVYESLADRPGVGT